MDKPKGKIMEGKVVAMPTLKTVIVAVTRVRRHPLYKKAVRRRKRFAVHNDSMTLAVGDLVRVRETKPISRTKHFIVFEKITV